jgi:hypothetical protein
MTKGSNSADELRKLLYKLLPPDQEYDPVIKQEQQQVQLNALDETVSDECFYFVFDLLICEISSIQGVEKWLGYFRQEFTVNRYLNCIAPEQSIQFNMIAHSMYQLLCKGVFKLQFYTQKYISLIALKHYSGEYFVFKKTTSVFQYDTKNRLLAQLNVFNKIGPYEGTPLNARITEISGLQKDEFERLVFEMTLKVFMEKKFFSPKEFEVLKQYARNSEINSNQLASLLDVAATTIDTYNKRILQKAKETFTNQFSNAKEVALFLKTEKIL